MRLIRRLFGVDDGGTGDPSTVLEEARGDERRLRNAGTRHREAFRHGGPLHDEYRAAWRDTHGATPATPADDLHLARWESYPDPSVRDIVDLCAATDLPYILLDLLAHDEDLDAREVVPELTDMANARGLRCTFVPG